MSEHICMVCFVASDRHDPVNVATGDHHFPPLCCHGCGCGEEQPETDFDHLFWPYVGARPS